MDHCYGPQHYCHNSQAAKARQEADQETDTAQEVEQADKVGYGEWHPHRIEKGSRALEPVPPIPTQHLLCTVSKKDDAQTTRIMKIETEGSVKNRNCMITLHRRIALF